MITIDGKKIRKEILDDIHQRVLKLPFKPVFCDVLVGDDPVSIQYVNLKAKMAGSVGMDFYDAKFSKDISTADLVEEIKKINKTENMCGIIVQLPLPPHIDTRLILDTIESSLDVDCLGAEASSMFYQGLGDFVPPTALAVIKILDSLNVDLADKKIVVLGNGELVGRPVTALLKFRNLDVVTLDNKTENNNAFIKEADVVISGIGKGKFLKGDMIKEGSIIIDAGTSESGSGIVGDVDSESLGNRVSYLSPVPGGVGPVTVAMLFSNVLSVAQRKLK